MLQTVSQVNSRGQREWVLSRVMTMADAVLMKSSVLVVQFGLSLISHQKVWANMSSG